MAIIFERNGCNIEMHQEEMIIEQEYKNIAPYERNAGVYFALKHNRYNLPYEINADMDDFTSWQELADAVTGKGGELENYIYMFVRWYEHSDINISLSNTDKIGGWDSGCAGIVFAKQTKDLESFFNVFKQEIEGDIWGYVITDKHGDFVDSLGGIYGYDYALEDAKKVADQYKEPRQANYAKTAQQLHA